MKILVTGASGFLGSHVAEVLAGEGQQVRLLLRETSSRRFLEFAYE
ncbi:MAG TPA: NAD-dependent epimerase/dehydratase family protein, partial [Dehalococcoidia bacterium]|nr:NAD-dependent epimerase/dehydratase family protein [Dehalococcoidia bacterium]